MAQGRYLYPKLGSALLMMESRQHPQPSPALHTQPILSPDCAPSWNPCSVPSAAFPHLICRSQGSGGQSPGLLHRSIGRAGTAGAGTAPRHLGQSCDGEQLPVALTGVCLGG